MQTEGGTFSTTEDTTQIRHLREGGDPGMGCKAVEAGHMLAWIYFVSRFALVGSEAGMTEG